MMQLKLLAGGGGHGGCAGSSCPTIYATDHGTIVVQGYTVTEPSTAELGPGESLVEIPADLLHALARS